MTNPPTPSPAPASGAETRPCRNCGQQKHEHQYYIWGWKCRASRFVGEDDSDKQYFRSSSAGDSAAPTPESPREARVTMADDALEPHFTPFLAAAPTTEGPREVAPCVACGREMFCPDPANRPDMWACTMWGCSFRHIAPAASRPGAPDVDDLADTIRESIYADDRQTRKQLDAGLAALAALTSEVARLTEDAERLDWLEAEHRRVDPVAALTVKRFYRRDGSEWANALGVRDEIDHARANATGGAE